MVNEGARILEEGIAIRASDIDVVWCNGYGWPKYRGGPMYWADSIGLDNIVATMKEFQAQHGDHWQPAPLLERLAAEGKRFTDS
jgi:3-hydroxyacyl-CoA dehydrogenase